MRNLFKCLILIMAVMLMLTACGGSGGGEDKSGSGGAEQTAEKKVDVDLTTLSSTMVYSEVNNMISNPKDYSGKVVKMTGEAASYIEDETEKEYYACIISDATACCAQGIEYELPKGQEYPDDGEEITVVGVFDTYEEEDIPYNILREANLVEGEKQE